MEIILYYKNIKMDLSYLGTIVTHLSPIMTRALPLIGTSLVLGRLLHLINK